MSDIEPAYLAEVLGYLSDQAHTELDQDRIISEDRTVSISLDMRYAGQAYELNVPLASLEPDGTILRKAVADFHLLHKTRYGHQLDDDLVEVVVVRLTALGAIPKPMLKSSTQSGGTPQPRSRREIHAISGGSSIIPVYHRDDLEPGHRLITPSIVQQLDSTAYLPFGKAVVDVTGSIVVDLP
jgi:N-methylhydantoinase A